MVELSIHDSTPVTTPAGVVTGPLARLYVESATVTGITYTDGHVQVYAGAATQPFGGLTQGQADVLPFAGFFALIVGGYVLARVSIW